METLQHLGIALSQYDIKEVRGAKDNPEILKYFELDEFKGKSYKDETAWCSAFANWVCKMAELPYSKKLNARSWLTVGNQTTKPVPGDVVVLWRESRKSWKGHVGFFVRQEGDNVLILGGNQNNSVNIKKYPKYRVLEYRSLC